MGFIKIPDSRWPFIEISTYQSAEKVVVGSFSQGNVPHVRHHNFFSHFRGAVENHVLIAPSRQEQCNQLTHQQCSNSRS